MTWVTFFVIVSRLKWIRTTTWRVPLLFQIQIGDQVTISTPQSFSLSPLCFKTPKDLSDSHTHFLAYSLSFTPLYLYSFFLSPLSLSFFLSLSFSLLPPTPSLSLSVSLFWRTLSPPQLVHTLFSRFASEDPEAMCHILSRYLKASPRHIFIFLLFSRATVYSVFWEFRLIHGKIGAMIIIWSLMTVFEVSCIFWRKRKNLLEPEIKRFVQVKLVQISDTHGIFRFLLCLSQATKQHISLFVSCNGELINNLPCWYWQKIIF